MASANSIPVASPPPDLSALRRHFEISLYLMLLTSVLTLVSTGKLDLITILLAPAALLFKGYRWWHAREPEFSSRFATWLTLGYFAFFPLDLWVVSRFLAAGAQNPGLYAALLATVHLLLFAIVVRLFSASVVRDYLFLALLAFCSMLASAILTVDTTFVVFLFLFLMLAVSTFVGLEMWRSAQNSVVQPMPGGTQGARRLHHALGWTSGGIALSSLVVGAMIFVLLPRFTSGYFSGFNMQPTLISGFSDNVELGEIGEIKKSSAVVMRVRVEGGLNRGRGIHWRGIALTTFDGKRWYNEQREPTTLTSNADGWYNLTPGDYGQKRYGTPVQYTVLLEPIASAAIFLANDAESLRGRFANEAGEGGLALRRSYLLEDATESVFNPYHNFARMEYEARSLLPTPPATALRQAGADYTIEMRRTYLQLPEIDPRIRVLAKQVTAHNDNPYDKARAIEGYLRSHYGYTLDLSGISQQDPLAYFLFEKRAGHCEYFAAAMAVMVRSLGIPARYVNGFQTGEYNDVGGDFVVRASDAHSWVEVYFPSYGWLTFDPTPPSDDKPPGFFARLGHYWDWLELGWNEWVVNYDFVHQFTLAQGLHRVSRDSFGSLAAEFSDARRDAARRLENWQTWLLDRQGTVLPAGFAAFALFMAAMLLSQAGIRQRLAAIWHLRIARPTKATPRLATIQYQEMLRLLARRGIRKKPAQTATEFAASIRDANLAPPVLELTAAYGAARFGGVPSDPRRISSLIDRIRSLPRSRPVEPVR